MSLRRVVTVRCATPRDAAAIATLFFETVHRVNSRDYDPRQVEAWAGTAPEPEKWAARIAHTRTFVASIDGKVVGFVGFEPDGHIDTLYVHHARQGEGIASRLFHRVETEAAALNLDRLYTESSITARPFFERRGFAVVARQEVERAGVRLANYQMEKRLKAG